MTTRNARISAGLTAWAALCLGIPALAEALNGLKPGGTPLGLTLAGQGVPLLLAAAALLLQRRTTATGAAPEEGSGR